MATLIYLAALVVAVMAVPMLLAIDPFKQSLRDSLLAPLSPGHLLGTDQFGRDVLLRLVDGGRASLAVGFGENAMYLGSDSLALAPMTRRIAVRSLQPNPTVAYPAAGLGGQGGVT